MVVEIGATPKHFSGDCSALSRNYALDPLQQSMARFKRSEAVAQTLNLVAGTVVPNRLALPYCLSFPTSTSSKAPSMNCRAMFPCKRADSSILIKSIR